MADTDERARRLAAQLRANLHRRKAQARGVAQASAAEPRAPDTSDDPARD